MDTLRTTSCPTSPDQPRDLRSHVLSPSECHRLNLLLRRLESMDHVETTCHERAKTNRGIGKIRTLSGAHPQSLNAAQCGVAPIQNTRMDGLVAGAAATRTILTRQWLRERVLAQRRILNLPRPFQWSIKIRQLLLPTFLRNMLISKSIAPMSMAEPMVSVSRASKTLSSNRRVFSLHLSPSMRRMASHPLDRLPASPTLALACNWDCHPILVHRLVCVAPAS